MLVVISSGHPVGGEIAAELAARVKADTAVPEHAAGMLPRLPGMVPMEAKLRQLLPGAHLGLPLELNPHPAAHHLGQFKEPGRTAPQQAQQGYGVHRAIHAPPREVDAGQPGAAG